jgi:hypothetical protein
MDFSRINRTHVWIAGAILILLSCGVIFGLFILNMKNTLSTATQYAEKTQEKAATRSTAMGAARTAYQNWQVGILQHREFDNRNPSWSVNMQDPVSRWQGQRLQEQEVMHRLKPMMEAAFNRRLGDLRAIASFSFPLPAVYPSQTFASYPIVFQNAGTVTVYGTYQAVLDYIISLRRLPRLCTLGAISFDSSEAALRSSKFPSKWIKAQFSVTVYEFVKGTSTGGAGGGGAPAAGGGYPGGGSSGYPGGGSSGYPGGGSSGYPGTAGKGGIQ